MPKQERADDGWRPPELFDVASAAELHDIAASLGAHRILDPIGYIADDLFELYCPNRMDDSEARRRYVDEILEQGPGFGRWVHYPWAGTLVHLAGPDDHYALRTYRNRNLITASQQAVLRRCRIAVFGLSVGSNVVDRLVQAGIGDEYLLFDFDRLSPTNLNRIQAGLLDLGLLKTTVAGRKIAELDPYVVQHHFAAGYDDAADDIIRTTPPDVIIEEVDNLTAKVRIRAIAKELRIPLVMAGDVGERSVLDVERHDNHVVPPFNGKLTDVEVAGLSAGTLPPAAHLGLLIKVVGRENISQVLLDSVGLKGKELGGTPQLGTTAGVGGALATVAVRDILLGRDVPSGSKVFDAADLRAAAVDRPELAPDM